MQGLQGFCDGPTILRTVLVGQLAPLWCHAAPVMVCTYMWLVCGMVQRQSCWYPTHGGRLVCVWQLCLPNLCNMSQSDGCVHRAFCG
jgi:hypothetical protein